MLRLQAQLRHCVMGHEATTEKLESVRSKLAAAEAHNVSQSYDLDKAWEERDAALARVAELEARVKAFESVFNWRNSGGEREDAANAEVVKWAKACEDLGAKLAAAEAARAADVEYDQDIREVIAERDVALAKLAAAEARAIPTDGLPSAFYAMRTNLTAERDAALARVKELELYIEADWDAGSKRKLRARVAELEGALREVLKGLSSVHNKEDLAAVAHASRVLGNE